MRSRYVSAFVCAIIALMVLQFQAGNAVASGIGRNVIAKSSKPGEIARAFAASGTVRVVVRLDLDGVTNGEIEKSVRQRETRAAMKARIARAIEAAIADHGLASARAGKGRPAITRMTTAPAFAVTLTAAELDHLAGDSRVLSIEHDRPMVRHLDVTLPLIGMPDVQALGGTGGGRAIAIIDDGIQRSHTFLGTWRLISGVEACFLDTNDCPDGSNGQIGLGAGEAAPDARHGTHVAGIALGNRASGAPLKGVATAAQVIPINIFGPNDTTSFSAIQRAFEYIEELAFWLDGTNPLQIAAVNMSVGGGSARGHCDGESNMALLKPVVDNLRAKGILSVVSAGNSYTTGAMSYPACLSSFVSVAATDRSGRVASYTSISPTTDLFAPGGEFGGDCVMSSVPQHAYAALCGTSMAAPHVAGAIAVLRQKAPAASACRIEDALKGSGSATVDTRLGGVSTKPLISVSAALARLRTRVAPANDQFDAAALVPAVFSQVTLTGSNFAATRQGGEPRHVVADATSSIWWRWTPLTTGKVIIDTVGSGVDTVLAVYQGATSAARLGPAVAVNDDFDPSSAASRVSFRAVAGQTYHIAVAGKAGEQGCAVSLNLTRPPSNDDFARAIAVAVGARSEVGVSGGNIGATRERNEPNHNGTAANTTSVWYKFTAPVSGPITLDTEGSALADTVLAVYKGDSLAALSEVAVDNDSGTGLLSRVRFNMVAGVQYRVAVVGQGGAEGHFRLWFSPASAMATDRATAAFAKRGE